MANNPFKDVNLLEKKAPSPCDGMDAIWMRLEHVPAEQTDTKNTKLRISRKPKDDSEKQNFSDTQGGDWEYLTPNTLWINSRGDGALKVKYPGCKKNGGDVNEISVAYNFVDNEFFKAGVILASELKDVPDLDVATLGENKGIAVEIDPQSGGTKISTGPTNPATPKPAETTQSIEPGPGKSSVGPIAGAAVGCLIGGLALGFLVAFFLFKKKLRRDNHANVSAVPVIAAHPDPKSTGYHSSTPPPAIPDSLQLSQFLLDTTPDRDMATELRALKDLIQQHVENHYHTQPVQANPQALSQVLAGLGVGRQGTLAPENATQLALNPATRQTALQHILSEVLFSAVDLKAASPVSMLPPTAATFATSIPPVERKTGDEEATALALTKWRALTAFLLHPHRSQRTTLTADEAAVAPQAQALATALNQFLEPFVLPDHNTRFQQLNHLQAVIFECTKLGYTVFSQPGEWAFAHRPENGGGSKCFVVCAGLVKVRSKDGGKVNGWVGQMVERPSVVPL